MAGHGVDMSDSGSFDECYVAKHMPMFPGYKHCGDKEWAEVYCPGTCGYKGCGVDEKGFDHCHTLKFQPTADENCGFKNPDAKTGCGKTCGWTDCRRELSEDFSRRELMAGHGVDMSDSGSFDECYVAKHMPMFPGYKHCGDKEWAEVYCPGTCGYKGCGVDEKGFDHCHTLKFQPTADENCGFKNPDAKTDCAKTCGWTDCRRLLRKEM